jgi:predicted metalloprotease
VATVLADTEGVWRAFFSAAGQVYAAPTLVLFDGRTFSACGIVEGERGESYCARDQRIYLDPAFLDELGTRYKTPGDFAEAYAVALGVSYHVQHLFGILPKVDGIRDETSGSGAGGRASKLELQALCLTGIWTREEEQRGYLDVGDVEEGLNAAAQLGGDTYPPTQRSRGLRNSSHGPAELRQDWFRRGYSRGLLSDCDAFRPALRR